MDMNALSTFSAPSTPVVLPKENRYKRFKRLSILPAEKLKQFRIDLDVSLGGVRFDWRPHDPAAGSVRQWVPADPLKDIHKATDYLWQFTCHAQMICIDTYLHGARLFDDEGYFLQYQSVDDKTRGIFGYYRTDMIEYDYLNFKFHLECRDFVIKPKKWSSPIFVNGEMIDEHGQ